jgi:Protein of unknown function (DUF1634).
MNMPNATSNVLKISLIISLILMTAGLLLQETTDVLLWLGLLVLICSPLLGIITTQIFLIKEKDWLWAKIAIILIVVIAIGLTVSLIK